MFELLKRDAQALTLRANILLPGVYAWLTTVAYPATYRGVPAVARWCAFAGLVMLVSGLIVVLDRAWLGRALGIYGFLGASVVTWLILGRSIAADRLEPVTGALGSMGWGLFALGWGTIRRVGTVPEDDPNVIAGAPLAPRSELSKAASLTSSMGVLAAILLVVFAFRVSRAEHALFAHGAALLAALGVLDSSSKIALAQGQARSFSSPGKRFSAASVSLAALGIVVSLGLLALLIR